MEKNKSTKIPQQAILLADSFTTNFRPITLERPDTLLPVVNVALIDHTLAWLKHAGVKEVFVVSCNHADQVSRHLTNSDCLFNLDFFVVELRPENAASAGDALRHVYEQDVIRSDFVLVGGDVVSNVELEDAIAKHKERREKDPKAILTMVVQKSKNDDDDDERFMSIDPDSNRLIHYEERAKNCRDCFIDICSPEVLRIFFDNFDYHHLRRHFLKGLLRGGARGYKVYTHEIGSQYAGRVCCFQSYATVSKHIIRRVSSAKSVIGSDTIVGKNSEISSSTVGSGTRVGRNSEISSSTVGNGCRIGENVCIDGCFIWNNVTIEDNCVLKDAIVCDGVIIKSEAVLEPGTILSYKVVVGKGFVVPANSKVSLYQQDSDGDEEHADVSSMMSSLSVSEVGNGGKGFIWSANEEISDFDDNSDDDDSDLDQNSDDDDYAEGLISYFDEEVLAILERYESENHEDRNVILEVNSLRLSCNLITADCAGALFYSIMKLALARVHTSPAELCKNAKSLLTKWNKVLRNYVPTIDEGIEVLMRLEELCKLEEEYVDLNARLIFEILYHLYDEDVLEEEAVMRWESEKEGGDESDKVFLRKAASFIKWLKEAPEEDE